jgi:integrase
MATGKITVAKLNGLVGWLWDEKVCGFGVRKQRRGLFYYVRYRHHGQQIMRTIGRHGSPWTPETARAKALELLGTLASGADPFAQALAGECFATAVDLYLDRKRSSLKPKSFIAAKHYLRNHSAPFHKLRLDEIDRRKVAALLGEIETASGPIARNRLRSSLSAFYAWAIQEGLCETSPVAGTGKADEGSSRERVLTPEELKKLWHALGTESFSQIVRLLLLTGQRRTEIGGLQWSEIELAKKQINLPATRVKNGRDHCVPLSTQALAIIDGLPRRNSTDYLFGRHSGYSDYGRAKQELDERLKIAPWRIHDLRRTCATGMARVGVQLPVIEKVLNHTSGSFGGIVGVYQRHDFAAEKRAALDDLAREVERIISGGRGEVVPMIRSAN